MNHTANVSLTTMGICLSVALPPLAVALLLGALASALINHRRKHPKRPPAPPIPTSMSNQRREERMRALRSL